MKKFRVKVDNQVFDVEVEEVIDQPGASPRSATANPIATAPASTGSAQSPAPQAETKVETKPPTAQGTTITAPLPGNIVEVKVTLGETVAAGDVLLVIEAMKMENEVVATATGVVKEILVQKGETVAVRQPLVVIG